MKKKGFTLIELLAVIVILAVIALIVTPIVTGIIKSAKEQANARSVEGHVKNIENAIILNAFARAGDMKAFDNKTKTEIEAIVTAENDPVTCASYTILNGTVQSAEGCSATGWSKTYTYTIGNGAVANNSNSEEEEEEVDPYSMAAMCPGCVFYNHVDFNYSDPTEYDSYEDAVAASLEYEEEQANEYDYEYDQYGHLVIAAYVYGPVQVEVSEDVFEEQTGVIRAFVCGSANMNGEDPFCIEASNNDEEVIERNINILNHFFDEDNECETTESSIYICRRYDYDFSVEIKAAGGYYDYKAGTVEFWFNPQQLTAEIQEYGPNAWYY